MAIRITRVYTRTGDDGTTAVVGGSRVPKDSPRIEAYGAVDELNAVIGLARGLNQQDPAPGHERIEAVLKKLQDELFDVGSELATPPEAFQEGMFRVGQADIDRLESLMDDCQRDLEPLQSFILPGGGPVGASLHQARTICRRAEREIIRLGRAEKIGEHVTAYVNRLGDLLFVLARWAAKQRGEPEHLWERGLRSPRASGAGRKDDDG